LVLSKSTFTNVLSWVVFDRHMRITASAHVKPFGKLLSPWTQLWDHGNVEWVCINCLCARNISLDQFARSFCGLLALVEKLEIDNHKKPCNEASRHLVRTLNNLVRPGCRVS